MGKSKAMLELERKANQINPETTKPFTNKPAPTVKRIRNRTTNKNIMVNNLYGTEQYLRLSAIKNRINLDKVGLDSTQFPDGTETDRLRAKAYKKWAVAIALDSNIASTEEGLVLREFFPSVDLTYPIYEMPGSMLAALGLNEWRWPVVGTYTKAGGELNKDSQSIYYDTKANINDYDRKVRMICGFQNLHPDRELYATHAIIKRADIKTIDIIDLQSLKSSNTDTLWMTTVVAFKRHDMMRMNVHVGPNGIGKFDNIKVKGIVAEALGSNVTG